MNQAPPPYEYLRDLFYSAEVVPFLGAGASFTDQQTEESESPAGLPTGRQLAYHLAKRLGLPQEEVNINNLIEVASWFELMVGRGFLEKDLEKVFASEQSVGSLHYFLADIPAPLLIITTNYDTLIERAFRERGRDFHVVMTPIGIRWDDRRDLLWWAPGAEQPVAQRMKEFSPAPEGLPVIYKLHGGFDPTGKWRQPVITEDDYFEIGGRIYESSLLPPFVQWRLQKSDLIFLGYSLRDIHVRQMISKFRRQFRDRGDFLVSKSVSRLDRGRFNALGVDIYELTVEQFTEELLRAGSVEMASNNSSDPTP